MKKYIYWTAVFLLCMLLAACGEKEEGNGASEDTEGSALQGGALEGNLAAFAERTEYYDITVKQEKLFDLGLWEKNSHERRVSQVVQSGGTAYLPLGTQFYNGEPVQLWAELTSKGADIYLYGEGGSGRLMMEGVSQSYVSADADSMWYLDREGDFYCIQKGHGLVNGEHVRQGSLVKILSSGEDLKKTEMEAGTVIEDICQTEDGRVYVLLRDSIENKCFLEEVDSATGLCIPDSRVEVDMDSALLGNAGDAPALTGYSYADLNRRIMKLNPSDGSTSLILSFAGTSYEFHDGMDLCDCQVLEDGSIELLWTIDRHTTGNGTGGLLENLKMEKVKKIPIVLRRAAWKEDWITNKICQFNMKSDTYQVILENSFEAREWEDFFRLTGVQIATGKGPDILCGDNMPQGYISGMLEKGALEDLAPYMEASGIREEDYFPLTFASWRQGEKIYGVKYRMSLQGERINKDILGTDETPDIETLADVLLAMEEDGVYYKNWSSGDVLDSFFEGTDSLWGMVKWESGTCDFNTPLFGKLLEAAKRHGYDGRKNTESTIRETRSLSNFVFYSYWEQEEEGKSVVSGVLFDDGCYAAVMPYYTLAMNANSPNKEGAWEFISFLLSEECQSEDLDVSIAPVNRKVFDTWVQWSIADQTGIKYENGVRSWGLYRDADVSEEKQAEYIKIIEEAKPLPMRTEAIRKIILEEAEDYFNGYKSAKAVSQVVNNRVQLYLKEMK